MVLHVGVGSQNLTTRFLKKYLILCSRTLFGTAHNLQETLKVLPTIVKETQRGFLEHWKIKWYSRLQKSCNKQAEQWKTTIDLLCLNQEEGHAEAGKIIRFICGKSMQSAVQEVVPI